MYLYYMYKYLSFHYVCSPHKSFNGSFKIHIGVTATADGRELLLKLPEMLKQLVTFVQDSCASISKCAAQTLINITGDEAGTNALLIISESSNSTENNTSSKQNVSGFDQINSNYISIKFSFYSVSRIFNNAMTD